MEGDRHDIDRMPGGFVGDMTVFGMTACGSGITGAIDGIDGV